jgi:PKD repeat protein
MKKSIIHVLLMGLIISIFMICTVSATCSIVGDWSCSRAGDPHTWITSFHADGTWSDSSSEAGGTYTVVDEINGIYQFEASGTWTFRLSPDCLSYTATNPTQPSSTVFGKRLGSLPPVAIIQSDTARGFAPLSVQFSDASTGSPTSWLWDFGDGTTSNEKNPPIHIYNKPDIYLVTLTVTNSAGSNTTVPKYIVVLDPALKPVASFKYKPINPKTGDLIQFDASSSYDPNKNTPLTYTWTFSDPVAPTGSGVDPAHAFLDAGSYVVTLTVKNSIGYSNSITKTVVVKPVVTVEIIGKSNLLLAFDSNVQTPMIQLNSKVTPRGGTYEWEIIRGSDKATIVGSTTSDRAMLKGVAGSQDPNDVVVRLKYTIPDYPSHTATYSLTVQKPALSKATLYDIEKKQYNLFNKGYTGREYTYTIQVLDKFSQPIAWKGMKVTEYVECISSNDPGMIKGTTFSISETTNNQGIFRDVVAPFTPASKNLRDPLSQNIRVYMSQMLIVEGTAIQERCQMHYWDTSKNDYVGASLDYPCPI